MLIEPKISQDPSSDRDKLKLTFEVPAAGKPGQQGEKKDSENTSAEEAPSQLPKQQSLPQNLSSQAQQVEAARQLQTVRGKAKAEAEVDEEEEQQDNALRAQQAVMPPAMLGDSLRQDAERLRQQRQEELKKAQAKFKDHFKLEQKKKEIYLKFKKKALDRAEKLKKISKEKVEQMLADGAVTLGQEIFPIILEIVTWICLFFAGVCGWFDWIADWLVSAFNLLLRGITQFRRVKKMLGLSGETEEGTGKIMESMVEKFLVQTVLPVVGGTIMENIPYVDLLPWEEVGVGISGLLIIADLIRSYLKVKSAEHEARKMANE